MTHRIHIAELPEFDVAEWLNSEADMTAYLTTVLEENDPALLATAHGDIARVRARIAAANANQTVSFLTTAGLVGLDLNSFINET